MLSTAQIRPESSLLQTSPPSEPEGKALFWPRPVSDFETAGLGTAQVESLILKFLLGCGAASGRRIASELGMQFGPFPEILDQLKNRKMLSIVNVAIACDFDYALTESGRALAKAYTNECAYVGAAPVPFTEYVKSVAAQTISAEQPREAELRRAFSDLLISEEMFRSLGPAINSGRGMFLYGAPGNGKTSIAERITRCFGSTIWIPRVLDCEGQLVKLFDPAVHEPVEKTLADSYRNGGFDGRWIEIRRPTLVVGGELTLDSLEISSDPVSRVSEAPLHLKSNNGTFLIDDFGRQRIPPLDLLNRWIVPLEKRFDFLTLPNGKKIQAPFDQLILFSTNLEPKQLVDEAFLRRIPYKIHVSDPSEVHFRQMFERFAPKLGFTEIDRAAIDHLIDRHYRAVNRPFRSCQPRDLLLQVRNFCVYHDLPLQLTPESFDSAAGNYFTVL